MSDEAALRARARALVQSGKLPSRRPDRAWEGPSVGSSCAVCNEPIGKDSLDFAIGFAHDGDHPDLDKFALHTRCFAAWEFERPHV